MRELMSEISNTIKHRYLNHTIITRTSKLLSEDHRHIIIVAYVLGYLLKIDFIGRI